MQQGELSIVPTQLRELEKDKTETRTFEEVFNTHVPEKNKCPACPKESMKQGNKYLSFMRACVEICIESTRASVNTNIIAKATGGGRFHNRTSMCIILNKNALNILDIFRVNNTDTMQNMGVNCIRVLQRFVLLDNTFSTDQKHYTQNILCNFTNHNRHELCKLLKC